MKAVPKTSTTSKRCAENIETQYVLHEGVAMFEQRLKHIASVLHVFLGEETSEDDVMLAA